ncbi:MAG: GH36-type glycosyl hydrolase domain-containing protein, partial [Halanaerobiales bacterium]
NVPERGDVFSDDHLWLLLSTGEYLRETGDLSFLEEEVPFADREEAPVYEHLQRALEFSRDNRGPHGLLLGLAADWNDCINLEGKGESVWSTFLYYRALEEFLEMARRLDRKEDLEKFMEYRQEIEAVLNKYAWDGDWFMRGYLNSGRKLGSSESDQSQIFLNAQAWAAVSGFSRDDKALKAMNSVEEYLATEYGNVLNYPAFKEPDSEVGAATTFPPGLKENGGIFCHANTWSIIAEALLGRGEKAFQYYLNYLPACSNERADEYTMEPYVYSQFITGEEHPYHFGRARNSWLTGTAAWSFRAVTNFILGVRADYDGLIIDPCVPEDWEEFEVYRVFRGKEFEINVRNPDGVSKGIKEIGVNGKKIEGNMIPLDMMEEENNVQVVMG